MTNGNLEKGAPWRFGPDWPGQRCDAKTRKGTLCQRPARLPVRRCKLHGGASTGPRTVLRALQTLEPRMGSTLRRREQRLGALPSKEDRCGVSWLNSRLGSWTMVIWTRTGEIGSSCHTVTAVFLLFRK